MGVCLTPEEQWRRKNDASEVTQKTLDEIIARIDAAMAERKQRNYTVIGENKVIWPIRFSLYPK